MGKSDRMVEELRKRANPQPFVGLNDLILFTWDADSGYTDMEDHHYGPEPRPSL